MILEMKIEIREGEKMAYFNFESIFLKWNL